MRRGFFIDALPGVVHGSDDSNECESETEGERKGSEKYHGLARLLTMMEDYRPVVGISVPSFRCGD